MKCSLFARFVLVTSLLCAAGLPALGQEAEERERPRDPVSRDEILQEPRIPVERLPQRRLRPAPRRNKIIYLTPEMKGTHPENLATLMTQVAASATIPLWNYTTIGYDGKSYSGVMVGRSPFFHGSRTTSIQTIIVPIIFNIGGTIFDPTAIDNACHLTASAVTLIQQSPLLSNISPTINGINVGTGQYTDIFQRSNFWTDVSVTGNSYHTVLNPVTVLSPTTLSPTATDAIVDPTTTTGLCGPLGIISNTWFDGQIQTTIIPSLASSGIGPTVFPIFLLYNVVQSTATPPTATACCILGYHNSFGTPLQTYSPLDFDGVQAFQPGFTSTMSHEIGEWMDDPNGGNAVPPWGAEGQQSGCQPNLEVGDPLSPGFGTPTNEFAISMPNGVTYDLQELAYYSWFYGGTSLGAGGKYSDNGTFSGFAIACPPGGTH
jgi:hypothetical protein